MFSVRPLYAERADEDVARILRGYRILPDVVLDEATMIEADDAKVEDNWSPTQIEETFDLVEALAFAGLAQRKFFDYFGEYSNRDSFALSIQKFEKGKGGSFIEYRRRDGATWRLTPEKYLRVRMPEHVAQLPAHEINVPLATAIAAEMGTSRSFDRAIREFNDANTDRPLTRESQELVWTVSAFQQLLEVRNGDPKETRKRFLQIAGPIDSRAVVPAKPAAAKKLLGKSFSSLRDLWIADLCNLRGNVAHGHPADSYPAIWTPLEHLLIAAFVFPLVAKLKLGGKYAISREESGTASVLDLLLASENVLRNHGSQGEGDDYEWHRVMGARFG